MPDLQFYALIHEHRRGRTVYGFYYQPTKARPYPSARRVVRKLRIDYRGRAGESIALYPVVQDPPDRVLTATEVGSCTASFTDRGR
jgi:hypothetical protein